MKAFFDPRQRRHAPEIYFRRGAAMPHQEQPRRAELRNVNAFQDPRNADSFSAAGS